MSTTAEFAPDAIPGETVVTGNSARTLVTIAVYALVILATMRPVGDPAFDPDVWWHLRVGQWVVENGGVTTNDPFSLPGQAKVWVAYSWLYEVLLYGLYSAMGLLGVVVYRVLVSLFIVAAFHSLIGRLSARWVVVTALTALSVLILIPLLSERPWLLTILFATLTLRTILEMRLSDRPPWWVWALPLVYILWANIHIQFIYGLFLFFLAALAALIDTHWKLTEDESACTARSRGWWHLILLGVLCTLATLINPYGVRVYFVVVEYATQPGPFRFVSELKALEFRESLDWMLLATSAAACFALGRRKVTAFEILLLAGTAFFAFRARRDIWFLLLADMVILATAFSTRQATAMTKTSALPLAFALSVLALCTAWTRDLTPASLQRTVATVFPAEACDVVRRRGYSGPLYNDFNWGGYLIWALPELPVAIDGRTNLHGDERIERFGRTWSVLPGWREDVDLCAANVVIAPLDSALTEQLRHDDCFELAHEDKLAVVFVRRR